MASVNLKKKIVFFMVLNYVSFFHGIRNDVINKSNV